MSHYVPISPRSLLIAGMSAAVVGTAVVTPVSAPAPSPARIAAAVELTSLASGLGGVIDNLNSFTSGIKGVFTNLGNGIGGAFTNLSNGIEGAYNNLTGGIKNVISSLTATINYVTSLPDGVQAALKNSYDGVERWPAYLADWAQFSLGLIPGLWWVAPSIAFAYHTTQPLARAGAYAFADLIGLDFAQFTRDISEGIKTSANNAVIYGKAWADSFVAVPELPPYPGPWPDARVVVAPPAAATTTLAAPQAAAVTSGIEGAIKNTYNAVEPWVAWGFELAQWGMGFVPGLWWVAPGISLGYFSIEPLVQAGVFTFADVLGLNFAQIGPDIQQGVQESANNFVNYSLAWIQSLIPFPPLPPFPPRPGAAVEAAGPLQATVAADTAAPAAATDVTAALDDAPGGHDAGAPITTTTPTADDDVAPATTSIAADDENTPATDDDVAPAGTASTADDDPVVPADQDSSPVDQDSGPVGDTVAPADDVATAAPEAAGAADPRAGDSVADATPKPSRAARPGHRSAATAPKARAAADDAGTSAGAARRPAR